MRQEEAADKSRNIQVTILQWQWSPAEISAEPVKGQKIEEYLVADLGLCNNENRPSLTSCALAEECQEVSLRNTIDVMVDAMTGGNNTVWSLVSRYTGKNTGILLEKWNRFSLTCSTTQERQKLVTEMHHKSYSSPELQRRSIWQTLALLFSVTNLCLLFRL